MNDLGTMPLSQLIHRAFRACNMEDPGMVKRWAKACGFMLLGVLICFAGAIGCAPPPCETFAHEVTLANDRLEAVDPEQLALDEVQDLENHIIAIKPICKKPTLTLTEADAVRAATSDVIRIDGVGGFGGRLY